MTEAGYLTDLGIALVAAISVTVVVAAGLSLFWSVFHRHQVTLSPTQYRRAIFGYAAIPAVVGVAMFIACCAVPSAAGFNTVPTHCHFDQGMRFCLPHAPVPIARSAIVGGGVAGAVVLVPLLALFARRLHLHSRLFRELELCSTYHADLDAHVLRSPALSAFCVGILRRRIFLTDGLIRSLSPEQVSIVMNHERGHARRADGILLVFLQVLTRPFNSTARKGMIDEFLLSVEHECDRYAARQCGDRLAVADTLVQLGRLRLIQQEVSEPTRSDLVFSVLGQSLERRVGWLLCSPEPSKSGITIMTERVMCYAAIMAFILAEPVHHLLEQALNFVRH